MLRAIRLIESMLPFLARAMPTSAKLGAAADGRAQKGDRGESRRPWQRRHKREQSHLGPVIDPLFGPSVVPGHGSGGWMRV